MINDYRTFTSTQVVFFYGLFIHLLMLKWWRNEMLKLHDEMLQMT